MKAEEGSACRSVASLGVPCIRTAYQLADVSPAWTPKPHDPSSKVEHVDDNSPVMHHAEQIMKKQHETGSGWVDLSYKLKEQTDITWLEHRLS